MSTLLSPFEIKPAAARNALLLTLGCAGFTAIGVWMVVSGQEVLAGALGVLFFGGGGIFAIPKILRRKVSMVLTRNGIEQHTLYGTAQVPWRDVERIGVTSQFGTALVGIRLKTYDNYLGSMSPELAEFMAKSLPYLKLAARAASLLDSPAALEVWSAVKGGGDPQDTLKSFGKVATVADGLLWSRQSCGFDLLFSWAERDRPAGAFAVLLEEYRQAAA